MKVESIMLKFLLYIVSSIIVIWSFDAVNINSIFKKNQVIKARVFYVIMVLIIIYLLTNFLYDLAVIKLF